MNNGMNLMRGGWQLLVVGVLALGGVYGCGDDDNGGGGGGKGGKDLEQKAIKLCEKTADCMCELEAEACEFAAMIKSGCSDMTDGEPGEPVDTQCESQNLKWFNCITGKLNLSCQDFAAMFEGESSHCAPERAALEACEEENEH